MKLLKLDRRLLGFKESLNPSQLEHHSSMSEHASEFDLSIVLRAW